MTEPQNDAERIEWLWNRLDALTATNASLELALAAAEHDAEVGRGDAERAREQSMQLASEVARMAAELNAARQAAVDAVREHIEATRAR